MKKIIASLASLKLSCTLFFLLFILTVLGTIDQKELGLYATQKKYFESMFLFYNIGPVRVPLPGVYLVLLVLGINTIVGSFVRIKLKPAKAGIWITHASILMLFVSSFITFHFSIDGHMTLAEGQTKSTFQSYHEWEFVITKKADAEDTETIYPFAALKRSQPLEHSSYPFKLQLNDLSQNARVRPSNHTTPHSANPINGYYLEALAMDPENERNVPGVSISIDANKTKKDLIVWGLTDAIYAEPIEINGEIYTFTLRKKQWSVPFAVQLNEVVRENHPGTMMARAYRSTIEKHEGTSSFKHEIYMNHPLRHKGYTFFQSGYTEDPNTNKKFSTFAVVNNPTDRWPEYACYILAIGMLIHFGITFFKFLKKKGIIK